MNHGHDFIDIELQAAHNFSDALKGSSVERVIYLGALQPSDGEPSDHLQARKATGDILQRKRKTDHRITGRYHCWPGLCRLRGDARFCLPLPSAHHSEMGSFKKLSDCIAQPACIICCSCSISNRPSIRLWMLPDLKILLMPSNSKPLARHLGKKARILAVPFLTPQFAARWLHLVTSVPTNIARALIGGLGHDLQANGNALQSLIPQRLLSYDEAVEESLGHESEVVRSDIWGFDPDALARWQSGFGYYPKQAGYRLKTDATAEQLWRQVQLVGGKEGYFYANYLWRIREWMDFAIGGDALKRYRRDPEQLELGDKIDSWKVINIVPNQFLSLLFGMKAPGLGRLEFTIEDKGDHREIDIRAWWHPAGFSGLLYWFAMMPAHLFIFRGMTHALVERCQAKAQEGKTETV